MNPKSENGGIPRLESSRYGSELRGGKKKAEETGRLVVGGVSTDFTWWWTTSACSRFLRSGLLTGRVVPVQEVRGMLAMAPNVSRPQDGVRRTGEAKKPKPVQPFPALRVACRLPFVVRRWAGAAASLALFVLAAKAAEDGPAPPVSPEPAKPPLVALPENPTVAALREKYPSTLSVALHGEEITRTLLARAKAVPGTPEASQLKRMAAEVLECSGDRLAARKLLGEVRVDGATPEDRAHASLRLGFDQILRLRVPDALDQFHVAVQLGADPSGQALPLIARAQRFAPYREILKSKVLPPFEATFRSPSGSESLISTASLKGRPLLLYFWRSSSFGELERGRELVRAVQAAGKRATRKGAHGVQVLGIALETDEAAVREAAVAAGQSWPQHWDTQGWEGAFVRAFAPPGVPHYFLTDATGRVQFVGGDSKALRTALAGLFASEPSEK